MTPSWSIFTRTFHFEGTSCEWSFNGSEGFGPDSHVLHHSCWSYIKWYGPKMKVRDRIHLNRHISSLRMKTLIAHKIRNLILIKPFSLYFQDRTLNRKTEKPSRPAVTPNDPPCHICARPSPRATSNDSPRFICARPSPRVTSNDPHCYICARSSPRVTFNDPPCQI